MGRVKKSGKVDGKLKINLENDRLVMYGSSSESSGCVLRGALTLKLNKPTHIKSLYLKFYGTISVSWNQFLEGSGYEQKMTDHQTLINHVWTFIPKQRDELKKKVLEAGQHSFGFELVLPGSLPESTQVAKYYIVRYRLKAVAERSSFLSRNYTCHQDLHLSRQKLSITTDYLDPVIVANHWINKIEYEISVPTKVYTHGDTIPIHIQALPLIKGLNIKYVSCIFKEYMTCRAIHGWFNGKNKIHRQIIQYVHKDQTDIGHLSFELGHTWSYILYVKVPQSMLDVQCDASNESVRVRHKLKFTMSIENADGHVSEIRAILPVTIAITNSIGGLPAYEESWRSLPYDPALMMALIQQPSSSSNPFPLAHLPTYHSLYHPSNVNINHETLVFSSDEEYLEDYHPTQPIHTYSLPNYEDI